VPSILKRALARPSVWLFVLVGAAALVLLLSIFARLYSPEYGLTRLIVIGSALDERGLASFRAVPKYLDPYPLHRWGSDGQYYAELALDPLLRDPQLRTALDDPPYRARRILLSWLAWVGGLGRPAWVLNAYASLNLVFWVGFAFMMGKLFRPHGWAGLAGFSAMLLTCGVVECVSSSFTDFPGFVLLTLGAMIGGAGGAGVLSLAALTREPNLLGVVALWRYRPPWIDALRRNALLAAIVAAPLALWFCYVVWRLGFSPSPTGHNLVWPLQGIMGKLGEFTVVADHGHIRWHRWFFELYKSPELHAVLTIVAALTQCVYVFTHRDWENRVWRVGALFAPYFLCISFLSWESHFTITRHLLPVTLAFNLVLASRPRRAWALWFLLGNCFVPFGIYQFSEYLGMNRDTPPPPAEYSVVPAASDAAGISVRFGSGWTLQEWDDRGTWRRATGSAASLVLVNSGNVPCPVELAFTAGSRNPRDLKIAARGTVLWSGHLGDTPLGVRTARLLLPPGETAVEFITPEPGVPSGEIGDRRTFTFTIRNLQLRFAGPP